jgi:hypothetical protein
MALLRAYGIACDNSVLCAVRSSVDRRIGPGVGVYR